MLDRILYSLMFTFIAILLSIFLILISPILFIKMLFNDKCFLDVKRVVEGLAGNTSKEE